MFTSPPTYPTSQPLSSSVPQLPATIIFNPGSVPGVPSYLPEQAAPFLSQPHLSGFLSHGVLSQESFSQGDLNSPGVFRRNLSIALSEVDKLQMLARTMLSNMCVLTCNKLSLHNSSRKTKRIPTRISTTFVTNSHRTTSRSIHPHNSHT